jgi:hypothetical protein
MSENKSTQGNQQMDGNPGAGEKNKGSGSFNQGTEQDPDHGNKQEQSSGPEKAGSKQSQRQKQRIDPGKSGLRA